MNDESEHDSNLPGVDEVKPEDGKRPGITAQKALPPEYPPLRTIEPTRYGDWEKAGRCIDF